MAEHDGQVRELKTSILIRIAAIPLMVALLALAVYIHNLAFTLFYACSLFLIVPCASATLFLFAKYTRDLIGKTIMKQLFGFDHISVVVVGQFCSPSVAAKRLTEEVHKNIKQYDGPIATGLEEFRKMASLRFMAKVSAMVKKSVEDFVRDDDESESPSIHVTANLVYKTF